MATPLPQKNEIAWGNNDRCVFLCRHRITSNRKEGECCICHKSCVQFVPSKAVRFRLFREQLRVWVNLKALVTSESFSVCLSLRLLFWNLCNIDGFLCLSNSGSLIMFCKSLFSGKTNNPFRENFRKDCDGICWVNVSQSQDNFILRRSTDSAMKHLSSSSSSCSSSGSHLLRSVLPGNYFPDIVYNLQRSVYNRIIVG